MNAKITTPNTKKTSQKPLFQLLSICAALAALILLTGQNENNDTPLLGKFYENVGIPTEITITTAVTLSLTATVMSAISLIMVLEGTNTTTQTRLKKTH